MSMVSYLDRKFYPNHKDSWDNHLFREEVLKELKPDMVVLDLGAGSGYLPQMNFKGMAAKICGIDPNPLIMDNPHLDEAKIGLGDSIPWPDAHFDLVISDNVIEHVDNPDAVFAEVSRVLKPGCKFLFKTPNKAHYMPLIARMTPTSFHKFYNKLRGRPEEDTFPTRYRANSRSAVKRLAAAHGFDTWEVDLIEGRPEYLRLTAFTYLFGIVYERIVNMTDAFSGVRILLVARLTRSKS